MKKTSMTKAIPQKMRIQMSEDPFYKNCCYAYFTGDNNCSGKIEWHHNLKYGGQRVNEIFAILPVCQYHHRLADTSEIRMVLDWIMLNRATDLELQTYSKAENYFDKKQRLNKMFGNICI